jgi:hypothetical protein
VAKRVRSRGSYRPGGQGPSRTKTTAPGASDPASDAIVDDVAYDEVEVDEIAAAAVASATPIQPAATTEGRRASRRERHRPRARTDELAARATAESTWVQDDLRRIGVITVILVVALVVAWVVFGYLDILGLY